MTRLAEVVKTVWRVIGDPSLTSLASSMAYSTMLAVIPLIVISLSLARATGSLAPLAEEMQSQIIENLTVGAGRDLMTTLENSVARITPEKLGLFGVAGLLMACLKLIYDVDHSIQKIFKVESLRPFTRRWTFYFLVLLGLPIVMLLLLFLSSGRFLQWLPWPTQILTALGLIGCLFAIFRWVPYRRISSSAALGAALFSSLTVIIIQPAYEWTTQNVMKYDLVYGSLASVFLFLLWLMILWYVFLLGASLCYYLDRSNKKEMR